MKKALLISMAFGSTALFGMYGAGGFWNTGSDSWSNPSDSHCPDENHCVTNEPLETAEEYVQRITDMSHIHSISEASMDYTSPYIPTFDTSNEDMSTTTTTSHDESSNKDE